MNVEILEECYIPEDDPFLRNNFTASLAHEIELEALEIAGHSTVELKASKELLGKVPEGRFRVHDEGNNVLVPVKGVKVRVNNIIKWDATYTDENGFYKMEKSFGTSVYYSILMENSKGFKIWGDWAFLAPAKYEMGYHDNDGHDKDFWRNSQGWRWMVVNNAVWEHRGYSSDLYLYCYPPQDMRIWVFENNHGNVNGSAAMLRRTYGTFGLSEEDAGDYIFYKNLINLGVSLTDFSRTMSPDLTINLDCDLSWLKYNIVTSLTYHECSHASHWSLVGNEYWVDYINYIISASLLQGSVYGDGTLSNAWKCGIGEMWANFCGEYLLTLERFSNTSGYNDGYSWFNPGLLERSYNIVDLNIWEIVDCIGPEIDDIELLIDKLKTKTNYDSQVDAAYNAYLDWP